ncbi:unnamed protein product [Rotaria sp. Silwood1]|nr:unnamed protein product [Rotaria sp. Silwood1]CAF3524258.1 unnamed protein product [Rotaria sp. Silwood1]CAF3570717.1 unnamed protein product [Rotaria sp. Silwood1]CAF4611451.1 unnamed protein product [Rotaria sp. Silwood1]CAF4649324.1 unnamed protein product [Rotaria sp. Silwood1]
MALSQTSSSIHSSIIKNLFLFTACVQGDLQTIENHLNSVSSSNICSIRDENQATLIHYVSRYGHLNILKYFLEIKHIDISQLCTRHGATCLHDAAVCNQMDILKYIFNYYKRNFSDKLCWTIRDEQGNTPLHLAAYYNSLDVMHYLLEEEFADPHYRTYNGFQPIHFASQQGHTQCVKLLLSKSPYTVNQQTNQLLTPVHLACQGGSLETIQILISYGANLQLKDQNGLNCLHIACQNNHLDIVQWLIEKHNFKINDVDYMNNTPTHYAATTGNELMINYLLEKNAKIISNNNGNTPLHLAAQHGHRHACSILIERGGCSLTSVNCEQLTAADLAKNSGYLLLANELRRDVNSSSVQIEKATIVRLVIKKRNVPHADASNQVTERDLLNQDEQSSNKYSSWLKMTNQTREELQDKGSNFLNKHLQQESLTNTEDISTSTNHFEHLTNHNEFISSSSVVAIPKWSRSLIER